MGLATTRNHNSETHRFNGSWGLPTYRPPPRVVVINWEDFYITRYFLTKLNYWFNFEGNVYITNVQAHIYNVGSNLWVNLLYGVVQWRCVKVLIWLNREIVSAEYFHKFLVSNSYKTIFFWLRWIKVTL